MISKEFGMSLEESEATDMRRALNIMAMRAYDDVMTREDHGEKLRESDYKLVLLMEREAGVRED